MLFYVPPATRLFNMSTATLNLNSDGRSFLNIFSSLKYHTNTIEQNILAPELAEWSKRPILILS